MILFDVLGDLLKDLLSIPLVVLGGIGGAIVNGLWGWMGKRQEAKAARMQVAMVLRNWLEDVQEKVWDVDMWVDSDMTAGGRPGAIPRLMLDSVFKRLARIDHGTQVKLFMAAHDVDRANRQLSFSCEINGVVDENEFRGEAGKLFLQVLPIYRSTWRRVGRPDLGIFKRIKRWGLSCLLRIMWRRDNEADPIFTLDRENHMKKAIARLAKLEASRQTCLE
jgi:hypothetical protein